MSNIYCVVLCFCFVFLRLVYPLLPVSLDCPFLIAPSVFSNVLLKQLWSSNQPISSKTKQWPLILTCFTEHKTNPQQITLEIQILASDRNITYGGVEQTNGAPTLSLLITGSPTAMHVYTNDKCIVFSIATAIKIGNMWT